MKLLLIFDREVNLNKLNRKINLLKPSHIYLFPLTSQWHLIRNIEEICQLSIGTKIELMGSAKLIDGQVDMLREKISQWSADVGNYRIANKSLKEWFYLPKAEVSTWWFSLLSEKNTFKTDAFFNIAQLGAINEIITLGSFDLCIYSIQGKDFLSAIEALCKRHSVNVLNVSQLKRKSVKEYITSYFGRSSIINSILMALLYLRVNISRAIRAKLVMGPIKNRLKKVDNSILFVSHFPAVDRESAEKGKLKNKYAIPLQEKLSQMKKKIIWVWMYAFIDGHSFRDALELANRFAKNGEVNFFVDEFVSPGLLARSLFSWLRQICTFVRLRRKILWTRRENPG